MYLTLFFSWCWLLFGWQKWQYLRETLEWRKEDAEDQTHAGQVCHEGFASGKLHALGLVDYSKVLMLDLDLAILASLDELFDLAAPAALCRGGARLC